MSIETRRFLFSRYSALTRCNHLIEVYALNKEHALQRLAEKFPYYPREVWEYLDELRPEHKLGPLGETLAADWRQH